jgi:hypothetical protein
MRRATHERLRESFQVELLEFNKLRLVSLPFFQLRLDGIFLIYEATLRSLPGIKMVIHGLVPGGGRMTGTFCPAQTTRTVTSERGRKNFKKVRKMRARNWNLHQEQVFEAFFFARPASEEKLN